MSNNNDIIFSEDKFSNALKEKGINSFETMSKLYSDYKKDVNNPEEIQYFMKKLCFRDMLPAKIAISVCKSLGLNYNEYKDTIEKMNYGVSEARAKNSKLNNQFKQKLEQELMNSVIEFSKNVEKYQIPSNEKKSRGKMTPEEQFNKLVSSVNAMNNSSNNGDANQVIDELFGKKDNN